MLLLLRFACLAGDRYLSRRRRAWSRKLVDAARHALAIFLLFHESAEVRKDVSIGVRNMLGGERTRVVIDGRIRIDWLCFSYILLPSSLVRQARSEEVARCPPPLLFGDSFLYCQIPGVTKSTVLGVDTARVGLELIS